jgi:ligand-binding sensor domain-containing protein
MKQRNLPGILVLALCGILALVPVAMAETVTFAAGSGQISSEGVLDIAENLHGVLFFGTDNGLSYYDGSWHILHRTIEYSRQGLLSDHVLALEFDGGGNLWIGYPNGLQRLEGGSFVSVQDQQLLKSLDIHGLLRRGKEMWVTAGTAGLHRYRDGTWRWFRPGGPEGLGCNYVSYMATDPATGTLYASCRDGIWYTEDTGDSVAFSPLPAPGLLPDSVQGLHGDPFGGIYIFNSTAIFHFSPPGSWNLVTSADLLPGIEISDVAVGPDRTLWVATNNGIYGWRDGRVRSHFDTNSGIGSDAVKMIYLDSSQRLWFVTPENVGYTVIGDGAWAGSPVIPVTTFELPTVTPVPPTPVEPRFTPAISISVTPERPAGPPDPLAAFLGGIQAFLSRLFGGGRA